MSYGEDSAGIDYSTAHGRDWPSVRQFSVFLEDRVGALLDVVRRFETSDVRIVALSIVNLGDCAVVRMVLSDPERALEIFRLAKIPVTESDLLVVQLPQDKQPLLQICKALLASEVNVHYAYPILVGPHGLPSLALYVDNHEQAVQTLTGKGFTVFTENDLGE